MKQRRMTAAALACGVLCALCVAAFLWSVQGEADAARAEALERYGGEQVEVCVALRDVAAGERLDASAIESKLWIADLLPEGAVSEAGLVVGRTATTSIMKGEVIVDKRFQEAQSALDIPQGMQAVSVPAKAVQAVGGAIRPGMSVDVYSSASSGTSLLAQAVIVLATSVSEPGSIVSSDAGWITLAVSPERVEEIISAASKTSLYFAVPADAPGTPDAVPAEGEQGSDASASSANASAAENGAEESQPSEAAPSSSEGANASAGDGGADGGSTAASEKGGE